MGLRVAARRRRNVWPGAEGKVGRGNQGAAWFFKARAYRPVRKRLKTKRQRRD